MCREYCKVLEAEQYDSQEILDEICDIAHANNCRAHLDGARIFNAVIGSGILPAARMVEKV